MSHLHAVVMQLLAAKRAAADFCPVYLAARNLADQAATADVPLLPAVVTLVAMRVATADVLLRVVLQQHAIADVLLPADVTVVATADVLTLVHLLAAKNEAACWLVCSAARSPATLVHLADVTVAATAVANQPVDATADVLLLRVELLLHAAEVAVRRFNPLHLS